MGVSSINSYSALSQSDWIGRYGSANKNANLPEIEPVSAVGKATYDVNSIGYDRVKEYEKKTFGEDNTNKIDKKTDDNKTDKNEKNKEAKANEDTKANGTPLTEEEKAKVEKLKARDTEVKAHEQAHLSVAGDLATSGASYVYQQGPDGKQYAVGGEVNIDTSEEDTPDKTIAKMQRVIAAAMAPAIPSSQDYSVAASAKQLISRMRNQILQEKSNDEETNKSTETKSINQSNKSNVSDKAKNIDKPNNNSQNRVLNPQNNINNQLNIYQQNRSFKKGIYANFVA